MHFINILLIIITIAVIIVIVILSFYKKSPKNKIMLIYYKRGKNKNHISKIILKGGGFIFPIFEQILFIEKKIKITIDTFNCLTENNKTIEISAVFILTISGNEKFKKAFINREINNWDEPIKIAIKNKLFELFAQTNSLSIFHQEFIDKMEKEIEKILRSFGLTIEDMEIKYKLKN